jgi:hypothetical protein
MGMFSRDQLTIALSDEFLSILKFVMTGYLLIHQVLEGFITSFRI